MPPPNLQKGKGRASRRSRREAAMTLTEVVLGMFVLAVVFAGALTAAVSVKRLASAAQTTARANALLNTQMEELRAMTFDQVKSHLAAGSETNTGTLTNSTVAGNYPLSWSTAGTDVDDDLIQVTAKVTWAQDKRSRELRLVTYFYRDGISSR